MGRHAKEILGVVSNVSAIQPHKEQFRIRYHLNGVLTESYRAKLADAEALRRSLVIRAETEGTGPTQMMQATHLSTARLRAAEMAYSALESNGFVSGDTNAKVIVDAVTLFICEAKKMEQGVPLGRAYELFLASRDGRITKRTLKDYGQQVAPFIEQHKSKAVHEITGLECQKWIESFNSQTSQFRCYGYLEAFFAFCAGKHNPHVDGKPWIQISPVRSFPKPSYSAGNAQSYTFAEIVKVLKKAKDKGQLPYFVFRLFSMVRREEMDRMLQIGDKVGTIDFINTRESVIQLPPVVVSQKGKNKSKPRVIKIHPTFNAWLRWFSRDNLSLAYDHTEEAKIRRSVAGKRTNNLLRHTAITMKLKLTGDIVTTAAEAGNTPAMITKHYLALNIAKEDAEKLYQLTPDKARALGIL